MKIIQAANISEEFQYLLMANGYELDTRFQDEKVLFAAGGIITSTKLIITREFLAKAPQLKWIARLGSGLEIIDMEACIEKNIFVCNAPKGIADAVAEHCIAVIISMLKNITTSYQEVQNFQWIRESNRGQELSSKTIGLIGFGHTGQAFAKRLKAFGCTVLAYDPKPMSNHDYIIPATLDDIYKQADIVSYHVPMDATTTDYYKASLFAKPHYLINTSRGPIAATLDILQGFQSNQLLGACLDVLDFESEFPSLNNVYKIQLQKLLAQNCIITPHIAGYSYEAIKKMSAELAEKLTIASFL
jgi:D-3-phosphoglycerate dehydrogenase / 2-oxoglutarate reductase